MKWLWYLLVLNTLTIDQNEGTSVNSGIFSLAFGEATEKSSVCAVACVRQCAAFTVHKGATPPCEFHTEQFLFVEEDVNVPNLWIRETPYYLVMNRRSYSWFDGRDFCESRNGYLAEPVEHEEREKIWNQTREQGSIDALWLGIAQRDPNQLGESRDFRWYKSGGDIPSTSEYWKERSVNDPDRPETCGYIQPHAEDSLLHDMFCSSKRGFICEWSPRLE